MEYWFERVEPIREHDEYANWRAHISVLYGRMNPPVKIDIATGDSITPAQIEYPLSQDVRRRLHRGYVLPYGDHTRREIRNRG